MPNRYTVEDDNGNRLVLEGDSPPTEQELEQVFSQVAARPPAPVQRPNLSAFASEPSDEFGIGEEVRGVVRGVKRGVRKFIQAGDVREMTEAGKAEETGPLATADEYKNVRSELDKAQRDLRQSLRTTGAYSKEQGDRVEALLAESTRTRLSNLRRERSESAAKSFTKQQAELEKLPLTEAQVDFFKPETPWYKFFSNPVELSAVTTAESLPSMAPAIVGSFAGPVGTAAGAGVGSFSAESAGRVTGAMQNAGVDLKDPQQVLAWFKDTAKSSPEIAKANLAALGPATFDTLTAGLAGRWLRGAIGKGVKPVAGATIKEIGVQMAGGGAGSIIGSMLAGEPVDWKDVALEMAAELAPVEAVANVRAESDSSRARAAIARGPRREAITTEEQNENETQNQNQTEVEGQDGGANQTAQIRSAIRPETLGQGGLNAIFQRSPAPLPVPETPPARPPVVEEIRQPEEPALPQPGAAEVVAAKNPNLEQDLALLGDVMRGLRGQIGVPTQADLISVAKSPKPLMAVRDQIRRVLTEIERRQETMPEPWAYREQVEPVLQKRLAEIERQMMPPVERPALPTNIGGAIGGASENLPAEAQAIEAAANKAKMRADFQRDLDTRLEAQVESEIGKQGERGSLRDDWNEIQSDIDSGMSRRDALKKYVTELERSKAESQAQMDAQDAAFLKSESANSATLSPDAYKLSVARKTYDALLKRFAPKKKSQKPRPFDDWFTIAGQSSHDQAVQDALLHNAPVSRTAVDTYGIKLPEGYTRSGDQYVFKPSEINAPQGEPIAAAGETTPVGVEQTPAAAGAVQEQTYGSQPTGEILNGRVTYRVPATGKKSQWVKINGGWFRADSSGKPVTKKPLEPMSLRDALDNQLAKEVSSRSESTRAENLRKQALAEVERQKGDGETLADRLRGQRSATIGTVTSDAGVFNMSVRPDNSAGGLSVVLSNKDGSQSIRMNYRYDMTLAAMRQAFQEYLNIDSPGKFTVEIATPKAAVAKPTAKEVAPQTLKQEWKRQLKAKQSIRYKTASDEKAIERLKAKIANDPSKRSVGDGVGYRVNSGRSTQVNRGFRVVDVDRDAETVTVRQVADTGLTSSGGNFDRIGDTVVEMVDLVRDNKYTRRQSPPEGGQPAQAPKNQLTPMMDQYQRLKAGLAEQGAGDALLAFRLGDFYEFFFDDAKVAAQLLKIALTKRQNVDMAGVPYHAASKYFNELIIAGRRVAIADVEGTPKSGKAIQRTVTEILPKRDPEGGQPARPTEPKEPTPSGTVEPGQGGVPYYRKLGEQDALDPSRKRMRSVPQNFKLAYLDGWYAAKKSAEPAANLGTGLAEGRGMSPDAARAAIAGEPTGGFGVEIISKDRAAEVTGRPEARGYGGFFWQGKIYLVHENMAAGDVAGAKALLREEVGHGLLRTKEDTRRLQEVLDEGRLQLTEAEKQALRDQGYLENQLLDEFIAKSSRENLPWWASAVEKIRGWLSSVGLANLSNAEVARLLLSEIARTRQADISNLPGERLVTRNAIIIAPGITPPAAITAYHGTPHKVNRFSTAKIGTGEGAAVYGWGLYFAENPQVSGTYQRGLTEKEFINRVREDIDEFTSPAEAEQAINEMQVSEGQRKLLLALKKEDWWGFDYPHQAVQAAIREPHNFGPLSPEITEALKTFGNHYTVSLNVTPDELLDWDKPLSEQSEKVKAAIESAGAAPELMAKMHGAEIYRELMRGMSDSDMGLLRGETARLTAELVRLGIKGIRYLDQFSRVSVPANRAEYETKLATVRANLTAWSKQQERAKTPTERSIAASQIANHKSDVAHFEQLLRSVNEPTYNYVVFSDADISITHENGQPVALREAMGTNPLLPDLAPGQPTGEDDRPRHRVMGLPMGSEYDPQPYAQSRRFILRRYFGVTGEITARTELPVTPENTAYARKLVDQLSDPAEKGRLTKELKDQVEAAGGEMDAATQALQNELQDYATKSGDRELGWNLARNWGEFASELSAAGRELQAVKMSRSYQLYKEVHDFMVRAGDAAAKLVGKDLFDAVNGLIGRIPKTDKVAKEVETKVTTTVGAKPIRTRKAVKKTVTEILDEPKNDVLDELTNEEVAEVDPNELTAKSLLDPMEERPVEWLKPDAKKDVIREIVKAALKGNNPAEIAAAVGEFGANISKANLSPTEPIYQDPTPFTTPLAALLESQGVTPDTAARLALEIHKARLDSWSVARERAVTRASKRGTLSALVEEIRQTPYLLQRSPEWLRTTSENWFMSHGLSREQAVEAAKEFVPEFMEALTIAVEREATAVLKDKKLAQGTIDLIVRSIRSGLFDPAKFWYSDALAERGFKNITEADFKLLAELDKQYAKPDLSQPERSVVHDQIYAVWRRLGSPPTMLSRLASNFVATLLTGFRTVGINIFGPNIQGIFEAGLTAISSPMDFPMMLKGALTGGRQWIDQNRFSLGRDGYSFVNNDFMASQNNLKAQWERGLRQIKSDRPLDRAKGAANMIYGLQQYYMRLLNSIDNANGIIRRETQMALYTSQAMRSLGKSTAEIRAAVDLGAMMREAYYAHAIDTGMSDNEARVRASDLAHRDMVDWLENNVDVGLGERVKVSSDMDAYSALGRLGDGIGETDEGGLISRSAMIPLLKTSNWMRQQEGIMPALAVSLFGYVNVPYRTARYYAWATPYGLLRLGIHSFRKRRGMENWWKQSLATELQERQRWKQAIAGSAVFAAVTGFGVALLGTSADDGAGDDDDTGLYFTGEGPKNKQLRSAWLARGFKPNALVFFVDGKPISIEMSRSGEPFAHMTWLVAANDQAAWVKKEAAAKGKVLEPSLSRDVAQAAGTFLGVMGQRGFLQTVTQIGEVASGRQDPRMFLAQKGTSVAAGLVTPFLGLQQSIAGMMAGSVDRSSIQSAIAANFPILELAGDSIRKPAVNRFGDPLYNPEKSWYHRMYYTGIPIAFSVADSPTNKALYGLQVEKGVAAPEIRRSTLEQKYGPISDDQFQSFVVKSGALLKGDVVRNIPTLKNMTPEGVKSFLDKSADTANRITAMGMGLESRTPSRTRSAPAVSALPAAPSIGRAIPTSVGVATGRARAAISRVPRTSRARRAIRLTSRRPRIRTAVSRARRAIGTRFARVRRSARGVIARIRRPRFGLSFA